MNLILQVNRKLQRFPTYQTPTIVTRWIPPSHRVEKNVENIYHLPFSKGLLIFAVQCTENTEQKLPSTLLPSGLCFQHTSVKSCVFQGVPGIYASLVQMFQARNLCLSEPKSFLQLCPAAVLCTFSQNNPRFVPCKGFQYHFASRA